MSLDGVLYGLQDGENGGIISKRFIWATRRGKGWSYLKTFYMGYKTGKRVKLSQNVLYGLQDGEKGGVISKRFRGIHQRHKNEQADDSYRRQSNAFHLP